MSSKPNVEGQHYDGCDNVPETPLLEVLEAMDNGITRLHVKEAREHEIGPTLGLQ